MLRSRIIRRTTQYSAERNYVSEVITIEEDGKEPETVFSVDITPQDDDSLQCVVKHHTKEGTVYQREVSYDDRTGPFVGNRLEETTLNPEHDYLIDLFSRQG